MKELSHKEMSSRGGLSTKKKKGEKYFKILGLKGIYARGDITKKEFEKRMSELTK